jgi:hypothetical protein
MLTRPHVSGCGIEMSAQALWVQFCVGGFFDELYVRQFVRSIVPFLQY